MKVFAMRIFFVVLVVMMNVALPARADEINLGSMRVYTVLDDVFSKSFGLIGSGKRILMDCEDGRLPSNTVLSVRSSLVCSTSQVLTGVSDFYCLNLANLFGHGIPGRRPLSVGDEVEVSLVTRPSTAANGRQILTVTNLKLIVESQQRASWVYSVPAEESQHAGPQGEFSSPQECR